jgi:L-ribulose-5-phosphate 3-epimerase
VIFPPGTAVARMFVLAKAAGFDAIELRLDVDLLASGNVRSLAQDNGIEIASLWVSQALGQHPLNSPDPAIRAKGVDDIRRACDIAGNIRCGALLLVPGRVTPQVGYEETWKRIADELTKCLAAAENNNVLLTVENVWNKFLLSPLEMRTFVDQFHSPWLAAHFDMGNVMQFGYPEDWVRTLGSRIRRIHVKDYKLSTRAEQGRFVPLFEGDVNFAAVMRALREVNYTGYLSPEIEYDPSQPDQLANVSRQLDRIVALP